MNDVKEIRFEFGKNWRRFLSTLNDEGIVRAEQSLQRRLSFDRLDGKTLLDIGSGSGLFSLAARRLGARVRSFDFDPDSVACARELRDRYFPGDMDWVVEQASVLDHRYLSSLGTFDIVYSWGVLHHTGAMWEALENVKTLARMDGQLFIAIYNDLGEVTDGWRRVKRTYNRLPGILRLPFAVAVIAKEELPIIVDRVKERQLRSYLRSWTEYVGTSARAMSRWHDWIDWIGGYPYECSTIEEVVDFYGKDGFALECLESHAHGIGCNEFVFRRKAPLGTVIDNPLPHSRLLLRRSGRSVTGPLRRSSKGHLGGVPDGLDPGGREPLVLFRDGELIGVAEPGDQPGTIVVAPADWPEHRVHAARLEVVRGAVVPMAAKFKHGRGHMYVASHPELAEMADGISSPFHSSVFVFEGGSQLGFPHSIHDDIARFGRGRFSHWSNEVLFSTTDNTDPGSNGRTYRLVVAQTDARASLPLSSATLGEEAHAEGSIAGAGQG